MGEAKRKKASTVRFLGLMGMERENPIHLAESVWVLKGRGNFAAAAGGRLAEWAALARARGNAFVGGSRARGRGVDPLAQRT